MPQASDKLRADMDRYFQNGGINDSEPYEFLRKNGFREHAGMIYPSGDLHTATQQENDCIDFLCSEWDYSYAG